MQVIAVKQEVAVGVEQETAVDNEIVPDVVAMKYGIIVAEQLVNLEDLAPASLPELREMPA
jgi:hypothetical protein